jgi:Mg2+ and Co2+ transporter CorA
VRNIAAGWVFWVFGVGGLFLSCVILAVYFWRKRWF